MEKQPRERGQGRQRTTRHSAAVRVVRLMVSAQALMAFGDGSIISESAGGFDVSGARESVRSTGCRSWGRVCLKAKL